MILYFVGSVDDTWNNAGNWALDSGDPGGAGVPGLADTAIFDDHSPDCTLDVDVAIDGLDVNPFYTGTLSFAGHTLSVTTSITIDCGSGTVNMGSGAVSCGTLSISDGDVTLTSGVLSITAFDAEFLCAVFHNNNGTVRFTAAAGTQDFATHNRHFATVQLAGAATVTLDGNLTAVTLNLLAGAGTFDTAATGSALNIGAGGTTITAGTLLLGDQVHTWNGPLIQNGGTITCVTAQMNLYANSLLAGTVNMGAGSLFLYANLDLTGAVVTPGTGTLQLSGGGVNQTVRSAGQHFYDVVNDGAATVQLLDALTVNHDLSLDGANFDCGNKAVSVGHDFIMQAGMTGTFTAPSTTLTVANSFSQYGGTFTHNNGTVRFTGTVGAVTFSTLGSAFYKVEKTAGCTLNQDGNLDAYELDLSVGAGVWDATAYGAMTLTVGAGGMTMNGGTLVLGDQVHSWNGPLTQNGGTITLDNGATSQMNLNDNALFAGTLTMLGAGYIYVYANLDLTGGTFHPGTSVCRFSKVGGVLTVKSAGNHFYNVIHGDTVTVQLLDALTVNNDLILQSGSLDCSNKAVSVGRDFLMDFVMTGTFTAPSTTLTVGRNFDRAAGTFNRNGGTVVFANAALTSAISSVGGIIFNNLTFGASKTHRFATGQTFQVNGTLASNGTAAAKSVLVSGTPTTYWLLKLAGASTLANKTNITDCDASSGVLVSAVGSTDGGHNLNIDFAGAPPTPAIDFPVGANVPSNDEDWFYQYDLDPATLRAWNAVGNWAFFNNQPTLVNAGCFSNGFGAPPGIGDTIEFRFVMTQGRYNFRFWCPQDADCGIVSIAMNGYVIEPALDLYAAPAVPSYVYLYANRLLVPAGLQRLVLTVTGKNAGSSNYYVRMYGFQYAPFLPQLVV